jgi:hypothetical protein
VPIVGLPGAGIAATVLVEGRPATITGIVRRPYPSASDRRFAVLPRDARDVALGPPADGASSPTSGRRGGAGPSGSTPAGPAPFAPAAVDVDLGQLAEHVGQTVRVGGLVVDRGADGVTLDDGTAVGRVVLSGEAVAYLPLLERGDAINAVGTVEQRGDDHVVVVGDPAGLLRVGDLGQLVAFAGTTADPSAATAAPSAAPGVHLSGLDAVLGGNGLGLAGLVSLLLATAASAAVGYARRQRSRHRLAARIATRLATFGGPSTPPRAPARATHEP